MSIYKGRARKFGDNVDTDTVAPGSVLHLPMEEMKLHAFSPVYKDFYKSLQPGDVIHALNGRKIETLAALRDALQLLPSGSPGVLQIERDGKLLYVTFEMD